MIVGVPKETFPGERRVALTPAAVAPLGKLKASVLVQHGAGEEACFPDEEYAKAGASLASREEVFAKADLICQVRCLGANHAVGRDDLPLIRDSQAVVGLCEPLTAHESAEALAARGATVFALELLPRITRAQSMDVLSSQATIAGYKAVLLAASELPRLFPMLMTAAGTVAAARVLVLGAGVAGLQAIATARRLGAVVSGYDVRAAVREQIESLGARFVDLGLDVAAAEDRGGYARAQADEFYERQRAALARVVRDQDVVVTTAAIPGRRSPLLVTRGAVEDMKPGSVVVDLAAERGGNCELSQPDVATVHNGVKVLAPTNLAASVPRDASQMFSRNVVAFLTALLDPGDGSLRIDLEDEVLRDTLLTRGGSVVNERVLELRAARA